MAKSKQSDTAGCERSPCPIACILDILGDKWTLLVVRDLLFGKQTFKELQNSLERIPSNILSERLKRLERAGIIFREAYQERPVRYLYRLTSKGLDLLPAMEQLALWANKYLPETIDVAAIKERLQTPCS